MRKNTRRVVLGIFLLALTAVSGRAEAAGDSFSADLVTSSPQGTITMKMYSAGRKSRMEMAESIMIVRGELGWTLKAQKAGISRRIDFESCQGTADLYSRIQLSGDGCGCGQAFFQGGYAPDPECHGSGKFFKRGP